MENNETLGAIHIIFLLSTGVILAVRLAIHKGDKSVPAIAIAFLGILFMFPLIIPMALITFLFEAIGIDSELIITILSFPSALGLAIFIDWLMKKWFYRKR